MTNAIITRKDKRQITVKTRGVSAITTGWYSSATTKDNNENAITINEYTDATTEGDLSLAITAGMMGDATTNGEMSHAIAGGEFSSASVADKNSIACVLGHNSRVKGELGSWLVATEWQYNKGEDKYTLLGVVTAKVDGKKIKPNVWYWAENGRLVEYD